tara:strand:+ start:17436 stop:17675 length:240 start_codon:yes stop_codon:yes gene_type:complete
LTVVDDYLSTLSIPAIMGMIKLYSDHRVLKAEHKALQYEVNELKTDIKASDDKLDKRFDKLELLLGNLYTYERTHSAKV